jgi:hypothetical protein
MSLVVAAASSRRIFCRWASPFIAAKDASRHRDASGRNEERHSGAQGPAPPLPSHIKLAVAEERLGELKAALQDMRDQRDSWQPQNSPE